MHLIYQDKDLQQFYFPVNGNLSAGFDIDNKHYIDIIMPENSPVHSISMNCVFSEWTTETGYVIIVEHLNGLTSIYKHNASIVKSQERRWKQVK